MRGRVRVVGRIQAVVPVRIAVVATVGAVLAIRIAVRVAVRAVRIVLTKAVLDALYSPQEIDFLVQQVDRHVEQIAIRSLN